MVVPAPLDETLRAELAGSEVEVETSEAWHSPWTVPGEGCRPPSPQVPPAPRFGGRHLPADDPVVGAPAPAGCACGWTAVLAAIPGRAPSALSWRTRRPGGRTSAGRSACGPTTWPSIGLCWPASRSPQKVGAEELEVLSDSELLVKQMRGEYKVKNEGLKPLHEEARERLREFRRGVGPARRARGERQSRPAW